jgi:hypothetical protein
LNREPAFVSFLAGVRTSLKECVHLKVRSTRGINNHEKHHQMARGDLGSLLAASGPPRPRGWLCRFGRQGFSQMRLPNPVRPWVKQNPVEVMGSGVIIDGKRALTNAHLVLSADEIFVQGGQFSSIANCDFAIDLSQYAITVDRDGTPSQSDAVNRANHQQGGPAEILGITKARLWHNRTRPFNLV